MKSLLMTEANLGGKNTNRWRQYLKRSPWIIWPWGVLRAWQQERQIRAEEAYYRKLAQRRGIAALSEKQVKEALRARLSQRGLQPRPRAPGALRIIYASQMSGWEHYQIPPALASFGQVSVYSLQERGFNLQQRDWLSRRRQLDADLIEFVQAEHRRRPVDVIISYLSGYHVAPETIRALGELGIITCAFHWDDRLSFRGSLLNGRWTGPAPLASAYDLNLTNATTSLPKYFGEGGLAIFWPLGANPEHFRPLNRAFEYEVSFVGACYGQRPVYINYLRRHGIQVATFGPGWPQGPLSETEMVEVYARSRINLGFSGIGYSMREMCLKGRDFEVPMSGALYLTSEQSDLHRVYQVGQEVVTYQDKRSCLAKIRHLLAHPEECSIIRNSARARCLRDHTWEKRFWDLFRLLGALDG
jgi:spore maturation protein CgeB